MIFSADFRYYTSVMEFLDNAEVIYTSIKQKYDSSISLVNEGEGYLKYRVYITLHELPENRLYEDKRE